MGFPILVGAVVYDPEVVVTWDLMKAHFDAEGCPIDYVLYSNYTLQVDALLDGQIDIAWNSPLAWLDAQRRMGGTCRASALRAPDRDRVTHLVVKADSGIRSARDLRAKTIATGACDSPQATLLPLDRLRQLGLVADRDFTTRRSDVAIGKHGQDIGGELQAVGTLMEDEAHACAIFDLNWQRWQSDGTIDPAGLTSLTTTKPFDFCNFTVRDDFPRSVEQDWTDVLFRMSYWRSEHRDVMDRQTLRAWVPGRATGYDGLARAVEQQRFFERYATYLCG